MWGCYESIFLTMVIQFEKIMSKLVRNIAQIFSQSIFVNIKTEEVVSYDRTGGPVDN